jgi:uncharacterized protein (DUF934 family)
MPLSSKPRLIKDGVIVDNEWTLLSAEQIAESGTPATGKIIVPLTHWLAQRDDLIARGDVAVWLEAGEEPEAIAADLDKLPLVAINFPVFRDGRGYSYARELRKRYGYQGEIRSIGDVLQDQLFYMWRVGFNAYDVRADRDLDEALAGLKVYSVTYQGDVHTPEPIYRRRPDWQEQ